MEEFFLSFSNTVSLERSDEGKVALRSRQLNLDLSKFSPGLLAAIELLSTGTTENAMADRLTEIEGSNTLPHLYYYLTQMTQLGLICHTIRADDRPLATLIPLATPYNLQLAESPPTGQYRLSRFACCHSGNQQLIWESPLFPGQIQLGGWHGAALLNQLSQTQSVRDLQAQIPGLSLETIQLFINLLLGAKILGEVQKDNSLPEDDNDTLAQWEFHDLLFHSRSRAGRHGNPLGKSYRFLDKIDPLPAVKPKVSDDIIELYKPDIPALIQQDKSFTRILEQRQSLRAYDEVPISDRQLGEFLYRCARVRHIFSKDSRECSNRPYPGGGAAYELELYLTIQACQNIDPGLYHYCPQDHQLCRLPASDKHCAALLKSAGGATGQSITPQVLITLVSRFPRISWNYEAVAYSLTLKHVGVLYQTMYLVATAMDLAPCGIGAGNSDLFAIASGIDYYAETAVGEFILGSKPRSKQDSHRIAFDQLSWSERAVH